MKASLPKLDKDLLWSALSGLLLGLAFPLFDYYPLAWIALVPMFMRVAKRPFASGFTCGFGFFASVLYWLNIVMTNYGGLAPIFSVLAYIFLVAYLSLYFGAATWLAFRCQQFLSIPYLALLPFFWVASEYLRGMLVTGFPWALLGYSQANFPQAIQSADVTGVYGVSFLLVAVNCAVAGLLTAPRKKTVWLGCLIVVAMSVSHIGYGVYRLAGNLDERSQQLSVALIQGNIDQKQKWDPAFRAANVDKYIRLSTQSAAQQPNLIVWPEAATPFYLQESSQLALKVKQLPVQTGASFLIGSPSYEGTSEANVKYFNSAYLLNRNGNIAGRSDKVHLVPFGEYVPLAGLLSFIDKLVVGVGDFASGHVRPLPVDGQQLGVLICYEVIFPELARAYVEGGSGLLVNLTNDAWFGRSAAPYQHLAMARFRAIENRVWLARAANTGISAFIAPSGKIVQASALFTDSVLSASVGLGAHFSFYSRFGDVFAWGCLFITIVLGLVSVWRRYSAN